jgi:hypothetical protein
MPRKVSSRAAICLLCLPQLMPAQGPVYKLLYSPKVGSNIGYLNGIFEARPGLFYVLSGWTGGATGGSIFTLTSDGTFSPIYAFPQSTTMDYVVEATNGELYGSAFTGTTPYQNFYYSLGLSGKNLQEYPFPGAMGAHV